MGNPADKYVAVPMTGDTTADVAAINAQADLGYRFVAKIHSFGNGQEWILMGNYGG